MKKAVKAYERVMGRDLERCYGGRDMESGLWGRESRELDAIEAAILVLRARYIVLVERAATRIRCNGVTV